jgi:hypothetical protein
MGMLDDITLEKLRAHSFISYHKAKRLGIEDGFRHVIKAGKRTRRSLGMQIVQFVLTTNAQVRDAVS